MKKFNYLPNLAGSIGILAVLVMLEILIASALYDVGIQYEYGDPSASVIHVFAFGLILSVLMHFSGLTYSQLFHPSSNSVASTLKILIIPISIFCISSLWWLNDINNLVATLFPLDLSTIKMFERMMYSGVVSFIAICIVAPFLEEMLFRGIILRGLLGNHSPLKSILVSSILFGAIHFNIYQFVTACILGGFLGWLFYQSRSLWPCILGHAIYNTTVYIVSLGDNTEPFGSFLGSVIAIVLSVFSIYALNWIFSFKARANH